MDRAERILIASIATGQKNNLNIGLLSAGDSLLQTIRSLKTKAEQDNRMVYMEPIPKEDSLIEVIPASMVKSTPMVDIQFNEQPFFKDILPSKARQMRGQFNTEMEVIITKAATDAGIASNAARLTLSGLGLPGSLEAYKAGGKLPDNLWQKIERIRILGKLIIVGLY